MKAPCLVVGALNVDILGRVERFPRRDESVELADLHVVPGGHAGNCASALSALGAPARLLGCMGRDPLADIAFQAMRGRGIDVGFIERTDAAMNGVAFAPVLPDGDKALYIARGANVHLSGANVRAAARDCRFAAVFDPPEHVIPELAGALAGMTAIFAPGGLLVSAPLAVLRPLLAPARCLVVNAPESLTLSGSKDPAEAARVLAELHDLWAVVTLGSGGCWLAHPREGAHHRPAFPVDARDATGAGDAFVAGLVAAMQDGAGVLEAAACGCAVGALATRRLGAQGSLPTMDEVAALLGAGPAPAVSGTPTSLASRPALSRGSDGWRGRVGDGFDVEAVRALAAATARELRSSGPLDAVLVTHDGRAGSVPAAESAAAALAGLGLRVSLVPHLPTPVAARAVAERGLAAALLVTASHNSAEWNGVKLKVAPGMPPGVELEAAIERRRLEPAAPPVAGLFERGEAGPLLDAFCAGLLDLVGPSAIRRRAPRVVVDGLHGVAGPLFRSVLEAAGCEVILLGAELDQAFGGLVPDPMRPESRERAAAAVRANRADLGLVTDGDGDRLGVLARDGAFVAPHDVWATILPRARALDPAGGAVATTVATGGIVRRAAARLGLTTIETPVGFKHIAPLLASGRAFLGAGGVGDFGLRRRGFDRDPLLAALLLLDVLARDGRPLDALLRALWADLGRLAYRDMTLPGVPADLEGAGRRAVAAAGLTSQIARVRCADGVKLVLEDDQWLLLRPSTTESGLRVAVELRHERDVWSVVEALSQAAREDGR